MAVNRHSTVVRVDSEVYAALCALRRPFPADRSFSDVIRRILEREGLEDDELRRSPQPDGGGTPGGKGPVVETLGLLPRVSPAGPAAAEGNV